MYFHNEKDLFKDVISIVAERTGFSMDIIEKDYYVTMILKILSKSKYKVVFKGGTSLSKAYNAISRFSEDIDITFQEHLGENRRKRLKYEILKPIENELNIIIGNFNQIESDKDYNHYDYYYKSVCDNMLQGLPTYVKLETALMSYAFPVEEKNISNYIYDVLNDSEKELIKQYDLYPFEMCVQTLERTFVDKLFAICDYYLLNKPHRNSRHLYDIYMISQKIDINKIKDLIPLVKKHRQKLDNKITPSANDSYQIKDLIKELLDNDFYKVDYNLITLKLIINPISYEMIVKRIKDFIKLL